MTDTREAEKMHRAMTRSHKLVTRFISSVLDTHKDNTCISIFGASATSIAAVAVALIKENGQDPDAFIALLVKGVLEKAGMMEEKSSIIVPDRKIIQ